MMAPLFAFNPNLTDKQVEELFEQRKQQQAKLCEMVTRQGDEILARIERGELPAQAMSEFISVVSRCLFF